MKRSIGINADCIKGGFTYGNIKKLGELGFDSFFIGELKGGFGKYRDIGESLGMTFDFIHAPFKNVNSMWLEGNDYRNIYGLMSLAIKTAANNSVRGVILHLSSGWDPPATSELGFKRFDELVALAKEKRVTVAFENLRESEKLMAAMERYKDEPFVKFCYDCGHENCYTENIDWIRIFGDRLAFIHVHDNMGYDRSTDPDAHLLPFDGNIDFADMMRRLDEVGYDGPVMLEVFKDSSPKYAEMTDDEFLSECAARALRIAEIG